MICCILSLIIFAALAYGFSKLDANPLLAFYERFFPNKDKLRNKIVWVVGASTGIGEELCYQLAELNCRLILTATTESKLKEVAKECIRRSKNSLKETDVMVCAYDISDYAASDTAFKSIISRFGNIDVLVNNAARVFVSKITDDDFDSYEKLTNINYLAQIKITKLVVKHWLDTKSKGMIMATSSLGAYFDMPFLSGYIASKAALQKFYRDVSLQLYKTVKVVIICPGPVVSELGNKSIGLKANRFNVEKDEKMSTARCCELTVIAMANGLSESWVSKQPWLLATYLSDTFAYQFHYLFKLFGFVKFAEKRLMKNQ